MYRTILQMRRSGTVPRYLSIMRPIHKYRHKGTLYRRAVHESTADARRIFESPGGLQYCPGHKINHKFFYLCFDDVQFIFYKSFTKGENEKDMGIERHGT